MIYHDFEISDLETIRTFNESIDPIELMWHRDQESRTVVSLGLSDWKIQIDNKLPQCLNKDIYIPAGAWHRLIKGSGELVIKIIKEHE